MEDVQLLKKKPSWYRRWWGVALLVVVFLTFVASGYVIYKTTKIYLQIKSGTYLENKSTLEMNLLTDSLSPSWGTSGAPITIVEFADFNCPLCREAFDPLKKVQEKYSDKIKFYWRNYPVVKENSVNFALAGVCAERQGKFWDYHDIMFRRQGTLTIGDLEGIMKEIGVDIEKYQTCMDHTLTMAQLRKDYFASEDGGVRGTPTFFINGHKMEGALPLESWEEIITSLLKE